MGSRLVHVSGMCVSCGSYALVRGVAQRGACAPSNRSEEMGAGWKANPPCHPWLTHVADEMWDPPPPLRFPQHGTTHPLYPTLIPSHL